MAIIATVHTEGAAPPPRELVIGLICREFHKFPEEVMEQPADELLQIYNVLQLYDERVAIKQKQRADRMRRNQTRRR